MIMTPNPQTPLSSRIKQSAYLHPMQLKASEEKGLPVALQNTLRRSTMSCSTGEQSTIRVWAKGGISII